MVKKDQQKSNIKPQKVCSICNIHLNIKNPHIQCSSCQKYTHISCINLSYPDVNEVLTSYDWECQTCKKCSICHSESTNKTMLLCDRCDKGFHMCCLKPPLKKEPKGKWLCSSCTNELNENENKILLNDESIQENLSTSKSNNRKIKSQKKIQPVNINIRKNSISTIQVPINTLKPKRKSKSTSEPSKEPNINILKPKRNTTTTTTSPLNESKINILKPRRKSETTTPTKEVHVNILQPKRKTNITPPSSESTPKTIIKRIFIKVPPRKVRIIEDDESENEENNDKEEYIDIDDNDDNYEDETFDEYEEEEEEEEEEDDDDDISEDIDIEETDEENEEENEEYGDEEGESDIEEIDDQEEEEEEYYSEEYEEEDFDEEEKLVLEKEKALLQLRERYKELRRIVDQLSKSAINSKKVKKEQLQDIINKVKSIGLTTNLKVPIMNANDIKSITKGLKYIEKQFSTSSPLDYIDASVLGKFGSLESISPILNSGFSLRRNDHKRKRNDSNFYSIDDRIRYNNPILANTIFSRDTHSNNKTSQKYNIIPSPSSNYTMYSNARTPVKIVDNTLVKKASPAIREYLGEEGADTTMCMPNKHDYNIFVSLKKEIEEYQMKNEDLKILQSNPEFLNDENEELKKAKKVLEANESENPTPIDEYSEQLLKADQTLKEDCIKPVDISKNKAIKFGSYLIKMWFASPYPAEYSERPILYLCENCFKYLNSEYALIRHQQKCPIKVPPGNEIYRDQNISVFEVDGRKNKIYCQNLCLLSKLFLDHKTLYYDVEPFLFYIMTLPMDQGYKFVGYFSKEKQCESGYNLSCLLTLPIYQRKGYGNALIEFSYMLSKIEGKLGSPEKPLSDFGLRSYRKYWRYNVFKALTELQLMDDEFNIQEISRKTSITENDVWCTLYNSGLLRKVKKPFIHHRSMNNGPDLSFLDEKDNDFIPNKKYELFIDPEKVLSYVKDVESKIKIKLDPKYLRWNLYNMAVPKK